MMGNKDRHFAPLAKVSLGENVFFKESVCSLAEQLSFSNILMRCVHY